MPRRIEPCYRKMPSTWSRRQANGKRYWPAASHNGSSQPRSRLLEIRGVQRECARAAGLDGCEQCWRGRKHMVGEKSRRRDLGAIKRIIAGRQPLPGDERGSSQLPTAEHDAGELEVRYRAGERCADVCAETAQEIIDRSAVGVDCGLQLRRDRRKIITGLCPDLRERGTHLLDQQ